MTPTDLIFLYACACVISWGAHWMRVWERRDLWRIWTEYDSMLIRTGEGLQSWIPSEFCTNEYKINEVVNRAFIDTLWGIGPIKVSTPQIESKRENRKV